MSVCDAHESTQGCRKELSSGEGFLFPARFMQNSKIQEITDGHAYVWTNH